MFCAIDFGTSNSTVGIWQQGQPRLLEPEANRKAVPTALFFSFESPTPLYGNTAIQAYLNEEEGRFMRGLKGVLGTTLFAETTQVKHRRLGFAEIIGSYLNWLTETAEQEQGTRPTQLMLGRPVHFLTDQPEADAIAESQLRQVAESLGFTDIAFMPEPLAAAWHYEQSVTREELALIIDIGGGTGDFSLIRLSPERRLKADRTPDILAGHGLRLGGSGIDAALSLAHAMPLFGYGSKMDRGDLNVPATYYHQLTTWYRIHTLYQQRILNELADVAYHAAEPHKINRLIRLLEERYGHKLSFMVEEAKIRLSNHPETQIDLEWFEKGLSPTLTADAMATSLSQWLETLHQAINHTLHLGETKPEHLTSIFVTGGPSAMPLLRAHIQQHFPTSRIIQGDQLTSVGTGLIHAAHRSFSR